MAGLSELNKPIQLLAGWASDIMKTKCIINSIMAIAVCAAAALSTPSVHAQGGSGIFQEAYYTFNSTGPVLTNCVGQYYAVFKLTNGASFWFTAPTNVTSGTFTLLENPGQNIDWSMLVTEKALAVTQWCTNNSESLTFPATYSTPLGSREITNAYSFYLYINTMTNQTTTINNPLTLQVTWETSD